MLKAAAGGGGKGMRLVRCAPRICSPPSSGAAARPQHAFGDDEVYLEKFIERPRHIEMQILAD